MAMPALEKNKDRRYGPFEVTVEGIPLPLALTPAEAGQFVHLTDRQIRNLCSDGVLPTLPHKDGQAWRIPTIKFLQQYGMEYEIVSGREIPDLRVLEAV